MSNHLQQVTHTCWWLGVNMPFEFSLSNSHPMDKWKKRYINQMILVDNNNNVTKIIYDHHNNFYRIL